MSLSLQAIDRLFARLHVTYGRDFASAYEGLEMNAVKSSWAHELASFSDRLGSIAWALENLPPKCPNVIGFRALCRSAPVHEEAPALEYSRAGRARIEAELAKLGPGFRRASGRSGGSKDWARRIIENAANGIHSKSSLPLKMARAALAERVTFTPVVDDREAA